MNSFEAQQIREDAASATANLAGLQLSMERTESELDHVRERFGENRARLNSCSARLAELSVRDGAAMQLGEGGLALATGITVRPNVAAEFGALLQERQRLDRAEQELASRQGALENRAGRIRAATAAEQPRVQGLQAALIALDVSDATAHPAPPDRSAAVRAPAGPVESEAEPARAAVTAEPIAQSAPSSPPASGSIRDRLAVFGARMAGR
jgi:hypothetical protein